MIKKFIYLITILILIIPAQVYAQDLYPIYIIQPGDSLGGIANQFDISLDELITLNNITNPDSISPGQTLQIPGFGKNPGFLNFKSIGLFEKLEDLEITDQVSADWVINTNELVSPTEIFSGTELLVLTPQGLPVFQEIGMVSNQVSLLEESVKSNTNPMSLLLINKKQSTYRLIEGKRIFSINTNSNQIQQNSPQVTISPLPMKQGSTEVITVHGDNISQIVGQLNGQDLFFSTDESGAKFAIQGIHAMANPGLATFSLSIEMSDGTMTNLSDNIMLKSGDFDFEELSVAPELVDPSVTEPENEFVLSLVSNFSPAQLWDGMFQSPAVYQYYNSLFGTRRTYNGSGETTFHTGVDFGGGITLPIYSPASGTVVFAGPLTVRGNTVFIDHGLGIYSGFFHMNNFTVNTGDPVMKGQQIGEVGNTGRIDGTDSYYGAGAHLHWELWANGIQVDPLPWLLSVYP